MESHYHQILSEFEDPTREGLRDTPKRAAKAMRFLTQGYQQDPYALLNNALFSSDLSEMILVKNIELYSLCEHHLLPFFGFCHVAYLPKGKIIGLSKIPRIVDMFARRLQVQENLTQQIAQCIIEVTEGLGAAVVIEAQHLCMTMRGVAKQNALMKTSVMLGKFREDPRTRQEFLTLISEK